jgi:WD40 repeat protein/S1-C subfamily serine protease
MKGSDLRDGVVRVLSRDRQRVLGTGFLVTEKLVVTCSHVLDSLSQAERDAVCLEVLQSQEKVTAKLRPEFSSPEHEADFAVLELNRPLGGSCQPLPLGESARSADHRFTVFGFPRGNEDTGTWAHGTIGYATGEGRFRKLLLLESNIREGFSGGPLFDEQTRRVVGVVRFKLDGQGLREAYATPTELLVERCPELRTSEDCPYRDLASFRESDARFWKGRERVLREQLLPLLKKLPRFVEVSGPSGCGKSSLLNAGLVPALKEGTLIPGSARWDVRAFRPGLEPFAALDKAGLPAGMDGAMDLAGRLRRWRSEHPGPEARLVLVIDQLEDLLLRGGGAEEEHRQRFLQQLAGLKDEALPVTCVVALREGFDALLSQRAPALRSLLGEQRVQVPAVLTPDELRDIIAGPAREVGLRFEPPEVVETIVQAAQQEFPVETGVGARATVLPLLEVTMTQLWQASRDGAVTLEAFNASTGLLGMLARWADGVYETLGPAERKLADRLLLELIQFGVADDLLEDKGRRVPIDTLRERLGGHAEVDAVLQVLVNGRLLVTARDGQRQQDTVELIHDALLTHWKHFEDLRSRDRQFRRWYTEVQADAERWDEVSRVSGASAAEERLPRGAELVRAREMLAAHPGEVSPLAARFITRGEEAEQARQRAEQERARREQELVSKAHSLRRALGLMGLVVFVALAGTFALLWSNEPPEDDQDEARDREELRRARVEAADKVVQVARGEGGEVENLARAIELAGAPLPGEDDPAATEVTGALMQALSAFLYSVPLSVPGEPVSPSASAAGQPPPTSPGAEFMLVAAISPDARHIVTRGIPMGSQRLVTRVWDAGNGAMLSELDSRALCSPGCDELDLLAAQQRARSTHGFGFSPRDGSLWLGGDNGGLIRWSREPLPLSPRVHTAEITAVAFTASGDRALTASMDGTARLWDTDTGRPVGPPLKHGEPCEQAVLSPDGRYALVASRESTCLFDTATGACKRFELGGRGPTLGFSPSGKLAVLGDHRVNGQLLVWNVHSGRPHRQLQGEVGGHVFMPFFSEDECAVTGFDEGAMSAQEFRFCDRPVSSRDSRVEVDPNGRRWSRFTAETRFLLDGTRQQQLGTMNPATRVHNPFFPTRKRMPPPLFLLVPRTDGQAVAAISPKETFLLAATKAGLARRALDVDLTSQRIPGESIASPGLRWVVALEPVSEPSTAPAARSLSLFDLDRPSAEPRPLGRCELAPDEEWSAAFAREEHLAVACGGRLWVWNLAPAESLALTSGAPVLLDTKVRRMRSSTTLAFSADGRRLLTMNPEEGATLWSTPDGRMLQELGPVADAAFSPDGTRLALFDEARQAVRLLRAETGEEVCATAGIDGGLERMTVSWAGERFIVQRREGAALLGPTRDRDCRDVKELPLLSANDVVSFSPDGSRFATRSLAGGASGLWDSASGARLVEFPESSLMGDSVFSPDSRVLVFLSDSRGELERLDARTGERSRVAELGPEVGAGARKFSFTPDGSRLIVMAHGTIRLIETRGWKQVESFRLPDGSAFRLWALESFLGLMGSGLRGVPLWAVSDGRLFGTLHGALTQGRMQSNPAGDRILTSDKGEARLFSLRRKDLLRRACSLMKGRPEYPRLQRYCDEHEAHRGSAPKSSAGPTP